MEERPGVYGFVAVAGDRRHLLYVGSSNNVARRYDEHKEKQGWTQQMHFVYDQYKALGYSIEFRLLIPTVSPCRAHKAERELYDRLRPPMNSRQPPDC